MIKASIIVPVYNAEKYLDKCLNSIKQQTEPNFEAIIINDGSKDKSENIINQYLKDSRFKLISQENHGIGYSRNKGIKASKGKYLVFIDSDDYIEKNFLENMLNKIEKDKLDIVICDYIEENEETKTIKKISIPSFSDTTIKKSKELLVDINKSPWNKIYKKSFIKDINFPENIKYEDTLFLCQALKDAKIGKINKPLNHYVIHSKSETTTMNEKVFEILEIIDKIRYFYKKEKDFKDVINKLTIQIITTYTIQQRYQTCRKTRNKFINDAFEYLEKEIPNYKNNAYFKERGIKGYIEKSKIRTKIYCGIYLLLGLKKVI